MANPFNKIKVRYLEGEDRERNELKENFERQYDQRYSKLGKELQKIADQYFDKNNEIVIRVLKQLQETVYPNHEIRVHKPSSLKMHEPNHVNLRWHISSYTYQSGVTADNGAFDWKDLVSVYINITDPEKVNITFDCYVDRFSSNDGLHSKSCSLSEKELIKTLTELHDKPAIPYNFNR